MTHATLACAPDGSWLRLVASGHAGAKARGSNIVCAAVSMLLRTTLDVLGHTDGVQVASDASTRGSLAFSAVAGAGGDARVRLLCAADFLRTGLSALCAEYPDDVSFVERQD